MLVSSAFFWQRYYTFSVIGFAHWAARGSGAPLRVLHRVECAHVFRCSGQGIQLPSGRFSSGFRVAPCASHRAGFRCRVPASGAHLFHGWDADSVDWCCGLFHEDVLQFQIATPVPVWADQTTKLPGSCRLWLRGHDAGRHTLPCPITSVCTQQARIPC